LGIQYTTNNKDIKEPLLKAYSDASWATDILTRKSQTGFLIWYNNGLVDWGSKLQDCISLSSAESELVAGTKCSQSVVWLQKLMETIEPSMDRSCDLYCDNQSTIASVKNPVCFSKSKHISLRYFFLRDLVLSGTMRVHYISTELNTSDLLTKSPVKCRFDDLMKLLAMSDVSRSWSRENSSPQCTRHEVPSGPRHMRKISSSEVTIRMDDQNNLQGLLSNAGLKGRDEFSRKRKRTNHHCSCRPDQD
jgi:hypothetical protein